MRDRGSSRREDDWTPPAWTHPVETAAPAPARPSGAFYQPERARRIDIHGSGAILGLAIPPAVSGVLALAFAILPAASSGSSTLPLGMLALLFLQLAGLFISRSIQAPSLVLSWTACLFVTCLLSPLLALQVTLLREPYVSLARHSAAPALFASLVAAIAILFGVAWCVVVGWTDPDRAALLFMPAALMWPAMIGAGAVVSQRSALLTIGEVSLLSAAAMALALVVSPMTRIFIPAGTLAIEFALLWITGRGPWFQPTSGGIVHLVYAGSLALPVLLIVATPLLAMGFGTFLAARTADRASGARTSAAIGQDVPPPPASSRVRRR